MKYISKTIIIIFAFSVMSFAKAADIDYTREVVTHDGQIYKIENISDDESVIIASGKLGYLLVEYDSDGNLIITKD